MAQTVPACHHRYTGGAGSHYNAGERNLPTQPSKGEGQLERVMDTEGPGADMAYISEGGPEGDGLGNSHVTADQQREQGSGGHPRWQQEGVDECSRTLLRAAT